MEDSSCLSLLFELAAQIESITPEDIITPSEERPEGAEILGYAPFSLQQVYTAYAQLSEECAPLRFDCENAHAAQVALCAHGRDLSEDELDAYHALQIALARLSLYETKLDALWMLLLAAAARMFPSEAYIPHQVTLYSDWSVATIPEKEGGGVDTDPAEPLLAESESNGTWIN